MKKYCENYLKDIYLKNMYSMFLSSLFYDIVYDEV